MNKRQVLSTFVAAILVVSALTTVGLFSFTQLAKAQTASDITIKTSADNHGGKFFANGILQVIVTDTSKDDNSDDTLDVTIDANAATGSDSTTITVPNTHAGSQRFEFFLVNEDASCRAALEADADLTVTGCISDPDTDSGEVDVPNQLITFGNSSAILETDGDLFENTHFTIRAGDVEKTVNFQDTKAELTLDRSTYGSENIMRIHIMDQDGNIDPTGADTLGLVTGYNNNTLNTELFDLTGAFFNRTSSLKFVEQGDNSADFEAKVIIATDLQLSGNEESAQMELNDQVDYSDPASAANLAQTTDTSGQSFSIDDVDGTIDTTTPLTFASELQVKVTDPDRNIDSEDDDVITDGLVVSSADGSDSVTADLRETGDNTGVFQPDTSNNEIKITFVNSAGQIIAGDNILQLTKASMDDDLSITYADPFNDNSQAENFTSTVEVTRTPGTVTLPATAGVNDQFTFTLTAPNLNDNPRTADSYTFSLDEDSSGNSANHYILKKGGESIGNLAWLEFKIQGDAQTFDNTNCDDPTCKIDFTLAETGINTGIFTTKIDMHDVLDAADLVGQVDDGDKLSINFHDLFSSNSHESTAQLAIGSANANIDFSRTVLPIPPLDQNNDGTVDTGDDETVAVGNTAITQIVVTDPDRNIQSNTEDTLFDGGSGWDWVGDLPGGAEGPGFSIEVSGSSGINHVTIDTAAEYTGTEIADGVTLDMILPTLPSLTETGKATGVFDDDFQFINDGSLTHKQYQDLKVTVSYFDAQGDEQSSGITFRANDGIVTADKDQVRNGDVVTMTIQDEDLNLDDTNAEEFDSSVSTTFPYLLSVETEDDEVGGVATETFRETGDDTGIFTAEFTVGTDIPVSEPKNNDQDITQATNILVTYNDVLDSTGGSGDELETNIPVVSSTGAITITPELVGPGTDLKVTVTDQDLNKDPEGVDQYDGDNTGDGIVSFKTDNTDVDNDEASPKLTETGPNTGVFTFEIQLIPGENGKDSNFADARGGSDPEVGAIPGDILAIKYSDESNANGKSTTVSKAVEVKSFDPAFASDKDAYAAGDKIVVTISDPDANLDPDVADSIKSDDLRVFSDSDAVGNSFSAIETGKDTGVFKLTFLTSAESQSGSIAVKNGDEVTVRYTDNFPADYVDRVDNVNNPDKDFNFNIHIGSGSTLGSAVPTTPQPQDIEGKPLSEVTAGQQIVLSTSVSNKIDSDQPFVAIIEVRDSSGVTVFLGYTSGVLSANGQSSIGLSWTPDQSGDYQLRTFVLSDLAHPTILSEVVSSNLHVS